MKIIKNLLSYYKYFKNPTSCLLFQVGLSDNVEVKFKNSEKSIQVNDRVVFNKIRTIQVNKNGLSDEAFDFLSDVCSEKKIIPWLGANILLENIGMNSKLIILEGRL